MESEESEWFNFLPNSIYDSSAYDHVRMRTKMSYLYSNIEAEAMSTAQRGTQTAKDKLHLRICCCKTVSTTDFVLFHRLSNIVIILTTCSRKQILLKLSGLYPGV